MAWSRRACIVVIPATDPSTEDPALVGGCPYRHRPDVDLRSLAPTVKDMAAHSIEGVTHDSVSLSLVEARPFTPVAHGGGARGVPWWAASR